MHDASISNRKRTGERNVEYQRHYLKIARLLEELNHRYRDRVKIYPSFHYQVTHEALSVCHSVRREPDPRARQAIIADLFTTRTHLRMLRNARGIKQWYQLLLWLARLYRWRNK
jgi:heptose III glucuronosyltransferase